MFISPDVQPKAEMGERKNEGGIKYSYHSNAIGIMAVANTPEGLNPSETKIKLNN